MKHNSKQSALNEPLNEPLSNQKKSFNGPESNRSIDHFQEGKLSFDDDPLPGRRSLIRQAIYLAQLANSLANAGVLLLRSYAAK